MTGFSGHHIREPVKGAQEVAHRWATSGAFVCGSKKTWAAEHQPPSSHQRSARLLAHSDRPAPNRSSPQTTHREQTRQQNAAKKKPRPVGAFSIQSGLSFSQLLLILLVILAGQRLLLLVVQQFPRRLEELLFFFLQVVMNLLRQLLGRGQP